MCRNYFALTLVLTIISTLTHIFSVFLLYLCSQRLCRSLSRDLPCGQKNSACMLAIDDDDMDETLPLAGKTM